MKRAYPFMDIGILGSHQPIIEDQLQFPIYLEVNIDFHQKTWYSFTRFRAASNVKLALQVFWAS